MIFMGFLKLSFLLTHSLTQVADHCHKSPPPCLQARIVNEWIKILNYCYLLCLWCLHSLWCFL